MSDQPEYVEVQNIDEMRKSALISLIVIVVCIAICQLIAYFTGEKGNFTLNYLSAYTIGVQWIVFLHASGIIFGNERTEKYYDLVGSLTFLSTLGLSLYFAKVYTPRQIILSIFVAIWSLRLGAYLFSRIHNNNGVDSRFTEIKKSHFRFLMTWTLQGVWVFLTLLPVTVVNQSSEHLPLGIYDYIGMPIWIIGFLFEVISDHQKSVFRSNPDNKDKFISEGLWSISRHPNYFGEIMLWTGIAISAFGANKRFSVFISPIFVALLLIFVSGIPMLEEKADKRFGEDESYQKYKKSTPVLVPFINF
jgi:steroid 5-alpha reductase family enzyme